MAATTYNPPVQYRGVVCQVVTKFRDELGGWILMLDTGHEVIQVPANCVRKAE